LLIGGNRFFKHPVLPGELLAHGVYARRSFGIDRVAKFL
jgi:hypothetical protein